MTMVLKDAAGQGGTVRRLSATVPAVPVPPPIDRHAEALAAAQAEITRLRTESERLRRQLADAATATRTAVVEARKAGHAEGHAAGLAAAADRAADRIALLAKGVGEAGARIDARLADMDRLAAALIHAALAKLFADPDAMAAMVVATVARHAAVLRDGALLSLRVSGRDFADTMAIEAALGDGAVPVVLSIDPALPSGACRASLRLGAVDLDVPAQATRLLRLIDAMADA
ncbi:hypothetical protein [Sphingomonas sp. Leaf4]|uniref:hypothetical protein n=1 Tax=Sphingomonas sp. Leaf4 TaxID=2876553 RepID=UPI001E2BC679|nr:hypothetical protein [Sphingomonas sp. Leaf4]